MVFSRNAHANEVLEEFEVRQFGGTSRVPSLLHIPSSAVWQLLLGILA